MRYHSFLYFLFLPTVFALTYNVPVKARPWLLLAASWFFYASFEPLHFFLLLSLITINFTFGLWIESASNAKTNQRLWILGIIVNLLFLAWVKYLMFFADVGAFLWGRQGWLERWTPLLIPVGISIHCLQCISYLTDIHKRTQAAERDYARFSLFVSWFPQLTSGPLERARTLIPQLREIGLPSRDQIQEGLARIGFGFFCKIVIANNLYRASLAAFGDPELLQPTAVVMHTYLYAFRLYFDFFAYTEIAIGSSLLFGIRLSENFRSPFLATSIPEFWRRWHITLTSWFFEYLYYPLVKRFPSTGMACLSALLVFALAGLWHGADKRYLAWGLWHGVFYCSAVLWPWSLGRGRPGKFLGWLFTFHVVVLGWIFFRASTFKEAMWVFKSILDAASGPILPKAQLMMPELQRALVGLCLVAGNFLLGSPAKHALRGWRLAGALVVVAILTLALGSFSGEEFIYFRF